jgi:hypothetical protein
MTCTQPTHQGKSEMFEFAAGQFQQEERERRIAEGLRRRELLESASSAQGASEREAQPAAAQRRDQASPRTAFPVRAHAER